MTESPCKKCEHYEHYAPECFKTCKQLRDLQLKFLRSNDHHINFEYDDNDQHYPYYNSTMTK